MRAVLSGAYTPLDLREFVQLCHDLALPLVRKKIALSKLRLDAVGLGELDVVYDCLADLFQRDAEGGFPRIRNFFEKNVVGLESCAEEELVVALRRLIFGQIHQGLVRIYSEVDPTLGKILRNIKIAIEKSSRFDEVVRFGDVYLAPKGTDTLLELAPISHEYLAQEFARTVLVHDTIPTILTKLHSILVDQDTYQRIVSL